VLWSAAVVSDTGTWVQLIVVGSLVAADTGSAVRTGLVALATFAPQGISSPIGGLLADRFDRRKVFASTLLLQALMTSVLAIVLGAGVRTSWVLTVLILFGSAAGALGAPSYAALQPDLVPPDELMAMVSLGVYSWNSGRIIGPLLGTVLALSVGPAWTIAFNAATFIVLAIAVWSVRKPFLPHGSDGSIRERLTDGWRGLRATPGCWNAVVVLILFNFAVVPFMGLIPIYARSGFHGGTGLAGVFSSAQGAGAIIGGVAVTMLAASRLRSQLIGWLVGFITVALVAYAFAPTAVTAAISIGVLGAGVAAMFVSTSSVVQRDAPPERRGRVMALMQACMGVSYGSGLLVTSVIGDSANLHAAFAVGAAMFPVGFFIVTKRSRHWRSAFDGTVRGTVTATSAAASAAA
jgi:MFS family permease